MAASLTHHPLAVAALATAQALPWLLFTLPAGVLVDRHDRRSLLVLCQTAQFVVTAPLAILALTGRVGIVWLCVVGFLVSTVETVGDTAAGSALPGLVDRRSLTRVNGWLAAGQTICLVFVGPPLGSLAFVASPAIPFVVNTLTFLISVALLAGIPSGIAPAPSARSEPLVTALLLGIQQVRADRVLAPLAVALALLSGAIEAALAVLVLFVPGSLHAGPWAYGLLLTVAGAGSVLAAAASDRIVRRVGGHAAVLISAGGFAVGLLALAASTNLALGMAGMLLIGLGEGTWNTVTMTMRQTAAPAATLGRVLSTFRLVGWGASAASPLLAGLTASALGYGAPIAVAAAVAALTLGFLAARLPRRASELTARPAH